MINPPERSSERDVAVDALTTALPFEGWTFASLRAALRYAGLEPDDAELLFPGGAADMVEAFIDLADRRMGDAVPAEALAAMRLPDRVRALIAARLARFEDRRDAVRRAFAVLAVPRQAGLAARCTARTVDEIWHHAGDRSADASWYSKRAILASIYTATLLYWMRDSSQDAAATLAFLDRRLADLARIGRVRRAITARLPRLPLGRAAA